MKKAKHIFAFFCLKDTYKIMKGIFPIDKFNNIETPFYYYDTKVLRETLDTIKREASPYENYHVHYAIKANANNKILEIISNSGLGADCVSGGEVKAAIKAEIGRAHV